MSSECKYYHPENQEESRCVTDSTIGFCVECNQKDNTK